MGERSSQSPKSPDPMLDGSYVATFGLLQVDVQPFGYSQWKTKGVFVLPPDVGKILIKFGI